FSLVEEFFRAFSFNALINLHLTILDGRDGHHMAEALFKGTARAIDQAIQIDQRIAGRIPSTKEKL
ncbi:MAG: imidazoleglycerol-phosphate dehydratase, partial [Verrucomicrobiota bacterium]